MNYDDTIDGGIDLEETNKKSGYLATNGLAKSNVPDKTAKDFVTVVWRKPESEYQEDGKKLFKQVARILNVTAMDTSEADFTIWRLEGNITDSPMTWLEQWGFTVVRGKGGYRFKPDNGKPIVKDPDAISVIVDAAGNLACGEFDTIDDVVKRLEQFRRTPEQPKQKANGVIKTFDKTVSKNIDKTESEPKPDEERLRAIVHVFEIEKARAIVPRKDVCKGFPPPGEVSALAGKAGVGKTSLIMHYVSEATKEGHRALIWSFDMAYDFLCQYLLAYGAVDQHVKVIDGPATFQKLTEEIEKLKQLGGKDTPLLFVPDPFVDMFGTCSGEFMYNERTEREAEFNPNDQLSWVRAFAWFLPWVRKNRLSVLGTCHPAKGVYGHELPHSAKLQGYLHAWSILYRKGGNMRGFPEQWLIRALEQGKAGARLVYNGKGRGGHGYQHATFEYGEEVDKKVLNSNVTYKPSVIDNWTELEEEDFDKDEFDTSTGKGGVKTFSDDQSHRDYYGRGRTDWHLRYSP